MVAEVAETASSEDAVGDGVGDQVAIRGGFYPPTFVNDDAGEDQRRSSGVAMGVEAKTDAKVRQFAQTTGASGFSILGRARSRRTVASSSSVSSEKASSEISVMRAFESILLSAGEMPLVC